MASRKRAARRPPSRVEDEPEPVELATAPVEAPEPEPEPEQVREVYAWPSRSRCPRCGSLQTLRQFADGGIQHRRCSVPVCGHRYKVPGRLV